MKKTITILVLFVLIWAGNGWAQFATLMDSSDVAGWNFTTFTDVDDSLKDGYQIYQKIDTTDAVIDSAVGAERATISDKADSALAFTHQGIKKYHIDSTSENFVFDGAYHYTSGEVDSQFMSKKYIDDAAGGLVNQSVKGDHVDSTSEDFVFQSAYHVTSGEADSAYLTHGGAAATYITATLTQEEVDAFVDALLNDADAVHTRITITYDDSDNAMDFVVDSEPWDSLTAWANKINAHQDTIIDWTALVNQAKDSLTSWADKVNTVFDWGDHSGEGYITATLTEEEVEDYVGTMVDGGTETRIAVTYTDGGDGAGLLNFVVDDMNDGNAAESEIHDSIYINTPGYSTNAEIHDSLNANWAVFTAGEDGSESDIHDSLYANTPGYSTNSEIHDSLNANWSTWLDGDAAESEIHDSLDANWSTWLDGDASESEIHDSLFANTPGYATNSEIGDTISDHWTAFLGNANESEIHDSLDAHWTVFTYDADKSDIHDSLFANTPGYSTNSEIHDSLNANWSTWLDGNASEAEIHDSLNANWATFIAGDGDAAESEIHDTLDAHWDEWLHIGGDIGTGAFDFGGATSLEIPAVDNPTTDAEGEIAWDTNDDAIEVYSGDESESALIPMYQKLDAHIFAPDSVDDEICIFRVDALIYPHGIEIDQVSITLNADAEYSMVFEEWAGDPPSAENDISTVTTASDDAYAEEAPDTDAAIDADDYIYLHVPSTDIDWIHVQIIYHVNDGN